MAILAGGRTLSQVDVDHAFQRCDAVIAINRAFRLAPTAAWLYGCDADPTRFWGMHPEATEFAGTKIVVRPCGDVSSMPARWSILARLGEAGVKILRHSGLEYPCGPKHEGASPDPRIVRGNNSLFQILSIIAHTGASTVLLLGADMRGGHFHGGYPHQGEPNYALSVIPNFATLVRPLADAGIAVLNCCPTSAIPYWPRVRLRDVI